MHLVGFIYEIIQGWTVKKHKILIDIYVYVVHPSTTDAF